MSVPPLGTHVTGEGALAAAAEQIQATGARRVLLVTGSRSFAASGAEQQLTQLAERCAVRRWSDVSPNTDVEELVVGLSIVADFEPDVIVGVGGGSVMDMAKLLCAFEPDLPRDELLARIQNGAPLSSSTIRLVVAPTTSGSGSEATHFAVVYIGADKYSIAGSALRPTVVALDPRFARSGSPHQRATSGVDAICQAIESRWAVGASRASRRYSEIALTLLLRSITPFVRGDDSMSHAMQLGSHLAGRAIDISKTTAAHALSYGITKTYGVDHGSAAALTLGAFIERHAMATEADLQPSVDIGSHRRAMSQILDRLGTSDGAAAASQFRKLLASVGLPSRLSEVDSDVAQNASNLARSVNAQRLGNNPVFLDQDHLSDVVIASI